MKKVLAVLLVLVVAGVAFLYFPRGGVDAVNAAVLAVMNPGLDAQRTGAKEFAPAIDGDLFTTGDLVRSRDAGHGVLTFFDGSTVSVDPATEVRVTALSKDGADGLQATLEQTSGRISASVNQLKTPNSKFEVKTPTLTAAVRGTLFDSIVSALGSTIRVHIGSVRVRGATGGEVLVGPGQQVTVGPDGIVPPSPQPQPPAPKLRFSGPAALPFAVIDPRGYRCGLIGTALVRQMPGCDLPGGTVLIVDPVPGTYLVFATATQAVPDAAIVAEGLGKAGGTDFTQRVARTFAAGDLVRTSLTVTIGADGKLSATPFTALEVVTNVCGAEATGRLFDSGKLAEREAAFRAYALANKGQPAALVVTPAEMTDAANEVFATSGLPVKVTDVAVTIDGAGLHLNATFGYGPLSIPSTADVIAGVVDGKLVMRVRHLSAPPIPASVTDQLAAGLEESFTDLLDLPLIVDRVAFRPGCVGIIGKTKA